MKIKNLYINVLTKTQTPSVKETTEAVDKYIEKTRLKEPKFMNIEDEDFEEKYEDLLEEAREQLTKYSTQLRKINKILPLDAFVRQNINSITEMGKVLILKEPEFLDLCLKCGFPPTIQHIDILFDSNRIFCKILPVNKEQLALALAQKKITIEKYDELIKEIEE